MRNINVHDNRDDRYNSRSIRACSPPLSLSIFLFFLFSPFANIYLPSTWFLFNPFLFLRWYTKIINKETIPGLAPHGTSNRIYLSTGYHHITSFCYIFIIIIMPMLWITTWNRIREIKTKSFSFLVSPCLQHLRPQGNIRNLLIYTLPLYRCIYHVDQTFWIAVLRMLRK